MRAFALILVLSTALLQAFFTLVHSEDGFDDMDAVGGIDPVEALGMFGGEDGYTGDGYGAGTDAYGESSGGQEATELESIENISEFIAADDTKPVIIGYFDENTNEDDKNIFNKVSTAFGETARFGYTMVADVLQQAKYKGCAVFVYKPAKYVNEKMERIKNRYPLKSLTEEAFGRFVAEKSLPLVGHKRKYNAAQYDSIPITVVTVYTSVDTERNFKGYQYFATRLRKIAQEKEFLGKFSFVIADVEEFSSDLKSFGLTKSSKKTDALVGLRHENMYFKMDKQQAFSSESIVEFLRDFTEGKLVGKEKAPEQEDGEAGVDESNVVKLTSSNFADVVENAGKNVMVEFYAPWCGHCKHLKPEYADLANAFADDSTVTIAAMDATANDIPKAFDVQGYPTLFFVPANSKTPVPYEGERTASAMEEFIREHKSI